MWPTTSLLQTPLFKPLPADASVDERIRRSYERAREIVRAYRPTSEDIATTSPYFWHMHTDPIWTLDGAAGTLVTIHLNLFAGTLAKYATSRPDLRATLRDALDFKIVGQFCLTESGHGLDAMNLETTATQLPDGSFELNTPNNAAAKYMPPTSPAGIPSIAVVFARTIIGGEDRGVKGFLVNLNDGYQMCSGVISKLLPQRGGSEPLNHCLTYFRRVRLPASALLGSPSKPKDVRIGFFSRIFRVAVGTLAIGGQGLSALQVATCITAQYSQRRTITDNEGRIQPIMVFRTQHTPIAIALAQSYVLKAMHQFAVTIFTSVTEMPVRHGIATILKVVITNHALRSLLDLAERCGAQGLFEFNQLSSMHKTIQGVSIAEGDSLVLSIRLATEILLGRYSMIPPENDSLLARHETGVFASCRKRLSCMEGHRTTDFSRYILPQALRLVESIGQRIAYDAAVNQGVDQCLIDLYVASCVKTDPAWYAQYEGLTPEAQVDLECAAVDAVLPRMSELIAGMGVDEYAVAPITTQDRWEEFVEGLETFRGTAGPFTLVARL
ncbi:acyl-CoA dehydrogenase NM domain-like protein [Roridomyces roridus]|uniref:Acyl-CoA dehydrogenase NM domain-like protein n=1 Tax=Roridomyces roridus TaxID=1738132 RepID=A0AAD7CK68_9AGAR|nr:acyl-CoA dehydrogenase NM domain-like protein [Roridomyces roridus]